MAKRTCIFCGGGPLTKEHVFAQWIQRLAKIEGNKSGSVAFHVPGFAQEKSFEAPVFGRTARVVCANCNGGWMSKLESAAAQVLVPLFQGQSGRLSEADLAVLSAWAFKTALVIDAASLGGAGPLVPQSDRYMFRETLQMPAMSAVWMTTWPGTTSAWTQHWGLEIREDPNREPSGVNTYGATIAIFPLVFRTYATSVPAAHPDYFHETVPGISRIWPVEGPLDWEATFWLTAQQLEDFAFGIPRAIEGNQSGEPTPGFWHGQDPGPIRGPT